MLVSLTGMPRMVWSCFFDILIDYAEDKSARKEEKNGVERRKSKLCWVREEDEVQDVARK